MALMKNDFAAVLFDADGTLLDTLQDLADSMNDALLHFGFPTHDPARYKYFVGDGMENLVKRSIPVSVRDDPATVFECLQKMRSNYYSYWKNKSKPYPGIPQLLDVLSERGIRMAILSNKPDDFMQAMARELLSSWNFEVVMGERAPFPRKPAPAGALHISGLIGIDPEHFLYLGDTATDMLTANSAGMYAVGVLWGFRTGEELLASGARKLISEPAELLELL